MTMLHGLITGAFVLPPLWHACTGHFLTERLHRMRVVALQATDAPFIHLAAQKRSELIILILDLAVRIPPSGFVQNFQRIMVEKESPGLKSAGQIVRREWQEPHIPMSRWPVPMAKRSGPAVVFECAFCHSTCALQRAVAGFAAHTHLRHRGVVTVRGLIVILFAPRVLWHSAHSEFQFIPRPVQ